MIGLSIFSIIVSPRLYPGIIKEELLALLQLLLSMICFFGVTCVLRKIDHHKIKIFFFYGVIFLLTGVFLERTLPVFKFFSDSFRHFIYDSGVAESRVDRWVGFVRPCFFSREPSYVSHYIVLLSTCWYIISTHQYKLTFIMLIMFIGLILIGSPKIIILLPIIFIADYERLFFLFNKFKILFIIFLILAIVGFVLSFNYYFSERIQGIITGKDASTYMRLILPSFVLIESLKRYPLFGVGLGAKENALSIFNEKISEMGYNWFLEGNFAGDFHSFSLEAIHYYGILGGMMLGYLINRYLLNAFERIDKYKFWIILFFISLMGSPFIGTRTWLTIALLLNSYHLIAIKKSIQTNYNYEKNLIL